MTEEEKLEDYKDSISYFWKEKGNLEFTSSEQALEKFPDIKFAYLQWKMAKQAIDKLVDEIY